MPNIPLSSAPKESCLAHKDNDRFKVAKIKHLNTEVFALKEFILEQLYVTKISVKDIRSETIAPNNLELLKALKEEIRYLRNQNLTKTSIIKILTEKQAIETTLTPKIHQLDTQTQK